MVGRENWEASTWIPFGMALNLREHNNLSSLSVANSWHTSMVFLILTCEGYVNSVLIAHLQLSSHEWAIVELLMNLTSKDLFLLLVWIASAKVTLSRMYYYFGYSSKVHRCQRYG